jgi:CRP/FNR family transcriptional regulator
MRTFGDSPLIPNKRESTWMGTSDCLTCGMRRLGLFADLIPDDFSLIHALVDNMKFAPGATLFQEGDDAHGIFTLRTGVIKLVRTTADGRQRIVRVLRPGDVAGLEALARGRYSADAVALTEVSVCRIPLAVIRGLQQQSPRLNHRLTEKWSCALQEADDWLVDINYGTARRRVSNFVLKMQGVVEAQTVSLFAREDMGTMMDLKMETVSRQINALVREGTLKPLDKHGRFYRILNLQQLQTH